MATWELYHRGFDTLHIFALDEILQEKLLQLLRERGKMGIRDIARALRVTTPGAHYVLKPLFKAGIIERLWTHKNTRYMLTSLK